MPSKKRPLLKSKLLNFYSDDKLDKKAEAILKALPGRENSTTFIKQAICFYYDEAQKEKSKEEKDFLPQDLSDIIRKAIKETIKEEIKNELLEAIRYEFKDLKIRNIESSKEFLQENREPQRDSNEADVPDDVLNFINNL